VKLALLVCLSLLLGTAVAAAQPVAVDTRLAERLGDLELKWNLLVALFGINLVGMLPWYFVLLRQTKKRIDKKLDELISEKPGKLHELIDERDDDLRLRRETPVLVVATSLGTAAILHKVGFSRVTTVSPEDMKTRETTPDAPVIFDLDHGCSEEQAASLIETRSLESVLVYTSDRSNVRAPHVTYANSPVTLFSRLMELIRFRKALGGS
jgi:hypothetical protein